ncbi:A1S_2505 family phage non-structural protein [Synechococcus elongatus]|uniref:A1S_2505 family phage non-structural protein n=1 Tax=Synechococcus elongatus TaxID=32046 RepID=UPI000F7F3F34|nr:hypothetical protein [Synechococcus elongatus]
MTNEIEIEWKRRLAQSLQDPAVLAAAGGVGAIAGGGFAAIANGDEQTPDVVDPAIAAIVGSLSVPALSYGLGRLFGRALPPAQSLAAIANSQSTSPSVATDTPMPPRAQPASRNIQGRITKLKPNQIFVFGSNTRGRHGAGAAKDALELFGAVEGQARGLQGQSYAIVTKDLARGERSIGLDEIVAQLEDLALEAGLDPENEYLLTPVGTGRGGYSVSELEEAIGYQGIVFPENVVFVNW